MKTAVEEWRPVVGREQEYEVSSLGRVRSLDRYKNYTRPNIATGAPVACCRFHRGRLLRPGRRQSGHVSVALGRGASEDVHIWVLEAFGGPKRKGFEALHYDDNPSNNTVGNLRWGTRSENLHDAVRNGKKAVGEKHFKAKLKNSDIPIIRARLATEGLSAIGRDYVVSWAAIRQIRDGRSWRSVL